MTSAIRMSEVESGEIVDNSKLEIIWKEIHDIIGNESEILHERRESVLHVEGLSAFDVNTILYGTVGWNNSERFYSTGNWQESYLIFKSKNLVFPLHLCLWDDLLLSRKY
jgi:hypothetical protein